MDERTRVWKEIGLHYVLRTSTDVLKTPDVISDKTISPQQLLKPPQPEPDPSSRAPFIFYKQRMNPPIAALITYAHLDSDFRGQPNPQRLHLVNAIIEKAMPWDPEDVAFWPLALHSSDQIPDEDMSAALRQVITEFSPKYLLDFGGCFVGKFTSLSQTPHSESAVLQPTTLVILPSLEDMLPDNKPVKKAAWDIIRRLIP